MSYWRRSKTLQCINNTVYLNFKLLLPTVVMCNILNKRLPKDICIRKNALNRKIRVADPIRRVDPLSILEPGFGSNSKSLEAQNRAVEGRRRSQMEA
jgi:hypothetical protein